MATFNAPLPADVQSVQPSGHLEHHARLRAVVVELRTAVANLSAADITDSTAIGRSLLTAADAAAARSLLGATGSSVETLPPGAVLYVRKSGSNWPARPTARGDVMVFWVGADPSPNIVTSGTAGMLDGVDVRLVTP